MFDDGGPKAGWAGTAPVNAEEDSVFVRSQRFATSANVGVGHFLVRRVQTMDLETVGDLNQDGAVNGDDLSQLLSSFGYGLGDPRFLPHVGLSGDGVVTEDDLDIWHDGYKSFVNHPEAPLPQAGVLADMDADNDVDLSDFGDFQRCMTQSGPFLRACQLKFDFTGDGVVTGADLAGVLDNLYGPF